MATPIVLDTSVLLNFVKVGRAAALGQIQHPIVLLDHVIHEVNHPAQQQTIRAAASQGYLVIESVNDITEVALFADLRASGRLGAGECAVLAVALNRQWIAGLQDRRARSEGLRRDKDLSLVNTEDLVLLLIDARVLTIREADQLLVEWSTKHRFRSRVKSFQDLI